VDIILLIHYYADVKEIEVKLEREREYKSASTRVKAKERIVKKEVEEKTETCKLQNVFGM
jgi:predicted Holliday junction resolvase-like endonuclease